MTHKRARTNINVATNDLGIQQPQMYTLRTLSNYHKCAKT